MCVIRRAPEFNAFGGDAPNEFEEHTMQTATLAKIVRDPRSGEVHVPNERVAILAITQNLDRTLLKVRWEAGGDCVIFPDDVDEKTCPLPVPLSFEASSPATQLNYQRQENPSPRKKGADAELFLNV
jgi:hypothetical protein